TPSDRARWPDGSGRAAFGSSRTVAAASRPTPAFAAGGPGRELAAGAAPTTMAGSRGGWRWRICSASTGEHAWTTARHRRRQRDRADAEHRRGRAGRGAVAGGDVRHRAVLRTPSGAVRAALAARVRAVAGGALHLVVVLRHGHPGRALRLAAAADLPRRHCLLRAGRGLHGE